MIGRLPLYGDDSRESRRTLFFPQEISKKTAAILHFNRRRALLAIFTRTARAIKNAPNFTTRQKIYYEASLRIPLLLNSSVIPGFRPNCRVYFFKGLYVTL